MNSVNYRAATSQDLEGVSSLLVQCIGSMRNSAIEQWDDVYPNAEVFKRDVEEGALYLAICQSEIVGCAALNSVQEPEYLSVPWTLTASPTGVVHRLMIRPDMQGKGIGSKFMGFLEALAQEMNFETIRLDAFSQNPAAVALYLKLGYRQAGSVQFRKGEFYCFEKGVPRLGEVEI